MVVLLEMIHMLIPIHLSLGFRLYLILQIDAVHGMPAEIGAVSNHESTFKTI